MHGIPQSLDKRLYYTKLGKKDHGIFVEWRFLFVCWQREDRGTPLHKLILR